MVVGARKYFLCCSEDFWNSCYKKNIILRWSLLYFLSKFSEKANDGVKRGPLPLVLRRIFWVHTYPAALPFDIYLLRVVITAYIYLL
jgi:hypothetical protein